MTPDEHGAEHDDDDDARDHVDHGDGDGGKEDDAQENMLTLTLAMMTMLYMLSWKL